MAKIALTDDDMKKLKECIYDTNINNNAQLNNAYLFQTYPPYSKSNDETHHDLEYPIYRDDGIDMNLKGFTENLEDTITGVLQDYDKIVRHGRNARTVTLPT